MEEFLKKPIFYKLVDRVPTPCVLSEMITVNPAKDWRVRFSKINDEVDVSTVFLGHNLNVFKAKPLFFETMVMGGKFNKYISRCATWEEAENTHDEVCLKIIDNS